MLKVALDWVLGSALKILQIIMEKKIFFCKFVASNKGWPLCRVPAYKEFYCIIYSNSTLHAYHQETPPGSKSSDRVSGRRKV